VPQLFEARALEAGPALQRLRETLAQTRLERV
jgi:hypothetical protein